MLKEIIRKLAYEIKRREDEHKFAHQEFYFPDEQDEIENLEVGETQVSITAQLRPEL